MVRHSAERISLKSQKPSKTPQTTDFLVERIRVFNGTGVIVTEDEVYLNLSFRYLQLWLMVWNGYDGNIYITSANKLPNFTPPKVLVGKSSSVEKNWYPSIISHEFGDKIGGEELHLYWKHFPSGLGGASYFRTLTFRLSRGKGNI